MRVNGRLYRLLLATFLALPAFAQDYVNQALVKTQTSAVTWANTITVLGIMALGGKYMWDRNHQHGDNFNTIIGAVLLLASRGLATFFLPTAGS